MTDMDARLMLGWMCKAQWVHFFWRIALYKNYLNYQQNKLQLNEDRGSACHSIQVSKMIHHYKVPSASMVPIFLIHLWSTASELPLTTKHSPSNSTFQTSAKQPISNSEESVQTSIHYYLSMPQKKFNVPVLLRSRLPQLSSSWLPKASSRGNFKNKSKTTTTLAG